MKAWAREPQFHDGQFQMTMRREVSFKLVTTQVHPNLWFHLQSSLHCHNKLFAPMQCEEEWLERKKEEINITRHAVRLTNHQHNFVKIMQCNWNWSADSKYLTISLCLLHFMNLYYTFSFKWKNYFVNVKNMVKMMHYTLIWSWIVVLYSRTYVCTIHAHIHKCIHASTHTHTHRYIYKNITLNKYFQYCFIQISNISTPFKFTCPIWNIPNCYRLVTYQMSN
jgi:hypothetical protein